MLDYLSRVSRVLNIYSRVNVTLFCRVWRYDDMMKPNIEHIGWMNLPKFNYVLHFLHSKKKNKLPNWRWRAHMDTCCLATAWSAWWLGHHFCKTSCSWVVDWVLTQHAAMFWDWLNHKWEMTCNKWLFILHLMDCGCSFWVQSLPCYAPRDHMTDPMSAMDEYWNGK